MKNELLLKLYKEKIIGDLMKDQEEIVDDINEIASYIDTSHDDETDLTKREIELLNNKRGELAFIYKLITEVERIEVK